MLRSVHQCPRCELRFVDEPELEDHLRTAHRLEHLHHVIGGARENPSPH